MTVDYPIEVLLPSGTVNLGPDVCCDGFSRHAKARVQTHVHVDHMDGFNTSKGHQSILLTEPTKRLLIAELNADLRYRTNLKALELSEPYQIGTSSVSLLASQHMLGAVQVLVELEDGTRVGYSGDFQWPIEDVIQVDALVVDSTYGKPANVREFTQGECEERLIALVHRRLALGPVIIQAHRGTLQRALQVLNGAIDCPLIGSDRLCREVRVYQEFGYTIAQTLPAGSEEAAEALGDPRHIRIYSTGDQAPSDIASGSRVTLSAYFTRPDQPITEYSDRAFGVALSNHADFYGTLEYVRASGAKFVVTDNTRGGKGYDLATEITSRLGIPARPSTRIESKSWGQ